MSYCARCPRDAVAECELCHNTICRMCVIECAHEHCGTLYCKTCALTKTIHCSLVAWGVVHDNCPVFCDNNDKCIASCKECKVHVCDDCSEEVPLHECVGCGMFTCTEEACEAQNCENCNSWECKTCQTWEETMAKFDKYLCASCQNTYD